MRAACLQFLGQSGLRFYRSTVIAAAAFLGVFAVVTIQCSKAGSASGLPHYRFSRSGPGFSRDMHLGHLLEVESFTVISSFVSNLGSYRRTGALALIVVAVVAYGCGSSQQQGSTGQGPVKAPRASLKEEDHYRWEGEGRAKRKVYLSRREENKLLRERAKKSE